MDLRFLVPQTLTASRVIFAGGAIFAASSSDVHLAATLITFGAVTDGLDGPIARKLGVTSEFGALFDYFSDYLCYIVAPSILSFILLKEPKDPLFITLLGLPLLTGAVRYARNGLRLRSENFADVGIPGLGTVIYAFFIVTLAFTRLEEIVGSFLLNRLILSTVCLVSCLMVLPVRYPKLMKFRWFSAIVLPGFVLMPFLYTRTLAAITLALGCIYTFVSPLFMNQRILSSTPQKIPNSTSNVLRR